MAQYKVPQDVEAEDKLLGPFTFRQFIYLLIAFALAGVAFLLFKIFPVLVIIPVPFIIFLMILALPLKKDQPMETYLAAVISYYTKPHKRLWEPGEPESTIVITAPKKVEENRTKNLNEEEASRRLSFLADIVDTEGYAIKGNVTNQLSDEINAEASTVQDIFETQQSYNISQTLQNNTDSRHDELVAQMRQAIDNSRSLSTAGATINKFNEPESARPNITSASQVTVTPGQFSATPVAPPLPTPVTEPQEPETSQVNSVVVQPIAEEIPQKPAPEPTPVPKSEPSQDIIDLANNSDFSIETIAQQAKRINKKNDGEVYISLH